MVERSFVKPFSLKKIKKNKNLKYSIILPLDPFGKKEFNLKKCDDCEIFYFLNFKFILKGKVVIVSPSFGPSQTAFLMECLIESGIKNFILLGSCASLNRGRAGDVVIPDKSHSFVSVTKRYIPDRVNFSSSSALNYFLREKLDKMGVKEILGGKIGTVDAVFRETRSFLESILSKGCSHIDMESAVAFCLGEFYGVRVSSLLVVLDEIFLRKGKRRVGFLNYFLKMRKVIGIIEKIS